MAQMPIYDPAGEQQLMTQIWSPEIARNPEAFVLFAFPWGQPNTPLANFKGPRTWQRTVLRRLAKHIKDNDGKVDMETLRMAEPALELRLDEIVALTDPRPVMTERFGGPGHDHQPEVG